MIQLNERKAYKEIVTIINNMDVNYKNRIPPKLFNFFEANSDSNYQFNIDGSVSLKDQGLMDETKSLLALINLKYWCDSEEKKQSLLRVYSENERKYLKLQEEKFPTDIFGNNPNNQSTETQDNVDENQGNLSNQNMGVVKYEKEKWYKKIVKKILGIFKTESAASR